MKSEKTIRLAIVEDQQLLAQVLAAWVVKQPSLALAGWAKDGEEGLELCLATKPDVVLMDIELPGMDGLDLGKRLLAELPRVRLLAMSGQTDPYTMWRVWRSGVHGFFDKTLGLQRLTEAIPTVARGGTFFSPVFDRVKREWLSQPEAFYKVLSDREQEVLSRVVVGWDDERIGKDLHISSVTIAVHRKHIRQKLELHNDRDLVDYARRWGLDKGVARRPHENGASSDVVPPQPRP